MEEEVDSGREVRPVGPHIQGKQYQVSRVGDRKACTRSRIVKLYVCNDLSGDRLVMAASTIEGEAEDTVKRVIGVCLDRDRVIRRNRGSAFPDHGIADQPIKLNRLIIGRSDHISEQVSRIARGLGNGNGITPRDREGLGVEDELSVNGTKNVEVGLFADELSV